MPSWPQLQAYARGKYTLEQDESEFFSLVRAFSSGRSQKMWVRHYTAFETDWVEFRSVVCRSTQLDPRAALRRNAGLPIGALALDADDDYVLVHNAPLDTMDLAEFERPLHVIAVTADELEQEFAANKDHW